MDPYQGAIKYIDCPVCGEQVRLAFTTSWYWGGCPQCGKLLIEKRKRIFVIETVIAPVVIRKIEIDSVPSSHIAEAQRCLEVCEKKLEELHSLNVDFERKLRETPKPSELLGGGE